MNSTNRHAAYRRRIQRRRRIRVILILCASLLLLLFLAFLIVGNLLADNDPPPEDSDTEEPKTEAEGALPASVKARPLYLETTDETTLSSRLQALRRNGALEAAVPLNRKSGSLLYSSPLAKELGLSSSIYSVTIAGATRQAKNYGLSLCGVWYADAFREKDALLRSVRLSETASLLAEAAENGMKDVLLLAPDLTSDALAELILLSEAVHRLSPDAVLGVAIPSSFFEAEDSAVLIDDLIHGFDFLAIDATVIGTGETAIERVQAVASANLDRLLRYNMRLLLPYTADADDQAAIIAAAEQYSAKSWLILPPDP